MFKKEKTLTELQEEEEHLNAEVSVSRKKVLLDRLEAKLGKGSAKRFSSNGKKSGIDFQRIKAWLKNN